MEPIITNVNEIKLIYEPRVCKLMDTSIKSSADMYNLLMAFYDPDTISIAEEFMVVYLNNASHILGVYRGFKGGITNTSVDLRIIMNIALRCLCTQIIISHNHPSGRLTASEPDINITRQLTKCCELHNIKLTDHIIVTPGSKYLSMADEGLL